MSQYYEKREYAMPRVHASPSSGRRVNIFVFFFFAPREGSHLETHNINTFAGSMMFANKTRHGTSRRPTIFHVIITSSGSIEMKNI